MTASSTHLYLHPLSYQGKRLLGPRWLELIELLRFHLRQSGLEERDGEVLVFAFSHPHSAIAALQEAFARVKETWRWQPSQGPLPLQAVLHLAPPEKAAAPPPFTGAWDFLRQEVIHITRPLKHQWDRLMAGRNLPPHEFQPEEQGLFRVTFAGQSPLKAERLFPHRELPLVGQLRECYYCGMTHHLPASCPSKLLDLPMRGLPQIGHLPFADLSALFPHSLSGGEALAESFLAGVKAAQLRQDPLLQVFLAFFDLNRFYQLRFLHQIAFDVAPGWEGMERHETLQITNRNLHLGLDCLRVGQYSQADRLFSEEVLRQKGHHFCALVGQAFRSLEQGREKDMEGFLKKASTLAGPEKERIYIALLLSRFYDLQGDRWKAEHALNAVASLNGTFPEVQYRQCQLLVRNGDGERAYKPMRVLVTSHRDLFTTALMDPMLTPMQGLVDDLLATHYREVRANAGEGLERARGEAAELRGWFDEEGDPHLQKIGGDLAALERQYERQSYFDALEVGEKAERFSYECHRLRELKLDRLQERLSQVSGRWEGFHSYWTGYPYQLLFGRFQDTLAAARANLEEARTLSREVRGHTYRAACAQAEAAEAELEKLRHLLSPMGWVRTALDGLRTFGRKLLLAELLLGVLGIAGFFLLEFQLADGFTLAGPLLAEWPLQKGLSVLTLLVAPMLALAMTFWEVTGS